MVEVNVAWVGLACEGGRICGDSGSSVRLARSLFKVRIKISSYPEKISSRFLISAGYSSGWVAWLRQSRLGLGSP